MLPSFFTNTPGEGEYHLTGVVIILIFCSEVVSPMLLPSHCCGRGNVFGVHEGAKRVRQI